MNRAASQSRVRRDQKLRRLCAVLPLATLSACFAPTLPESTGIGSPILHPAQGCLQGSYESRKTRHGRHHYVMTELRKNGTPLLPVYGPSLAAQLLGATQDDREAHAAAVTAAQLDRAVAGLGYASMGGGYALMIAGMQLLWGNPYPYPPPVAPSNAVPLAIELSGIGLVITGLTLNTVFDARVNPTAHRAIEVYNEHCPK